MVANLPGEIWRYIFLWLDDLEEETSSRDEREIAFRRLASVCQSWRATCTNCSALWRNVTYDDRKTSVHAELLRISTALSRASLQPLDVSVAVSAPDPAVLSLVILSLDDHLGRTHKLDLALCYLDPPHAPRLDMSSWPRMHLLEDLTLENVRFATSPEFHDLLRFAPQLRSLRVGGISWVTHLPDEGDRPPLHMSLLESFTLDSYVLFTFVDMPLHTPRLADLTLLNTEYSLSWTALLSSLSWAASPSTLTLSGAFPESSVSMVLRAFPSVQHMVLYACPADVVHLLRWHPLSQDGALRELTVDRSQLSNLQALTFLPDPVSGEAVAPEVKLHIRNCPFVSPEVGAKLVQRGRGTFEPSTIRQDELLSWVGNDYTPFGLRFYPPKRRHRKAALTGHY